MKQFFIASFLILMVFNSIQAAPKAHYQLSWLSTIAASALENRYKIAIGGPLITIAILAQFPITRKYTKIALSKLSHYAGRLLTLVITNCIKLISYDENAVRKEKDKVQRMQTENRKLEQRQKELDKKLKILEPITREKNEQTLELTQKVNEGEQKCTASMQTTVGVIKTATATAEHMVNKIK